MNATANILPGARVRNADGFIGTVERLDSSTATDTPDRMILRSEDGQWRYALPLFLVSGVSHGSLRTLINVNLDTDQLPHYIVGPIVNQDTASATTQDVTEAPTDTLFSSRDGNDIRVPIAVEELTATKTPIIRGRVRLHKGVETTEQRIPVTLFHEEAVVEHIPPEQYDASAPTNPNEVVIPIIEEHLVVQKQSVVKEYLRIRKQIVEERQEVRGMVRREVTQVTEERNPGMEDDAPLLREDTNLEETNDTSPTMS